MSKINAIRLINVKYNYDQIRISDETMHFNGQSTLISLQNGGGKSVLVQLLTAPFVQKRYRNVKERQFKNYFNGADPTFIMLEWILENKAGKCLVGMMVRKNQNTESDEDLDIISFISEYTEPCLQDIHHLPVVEKNNNKVTVKGFGACKALFDAYKKDKLNSFFYYDMNNQAQSKQYINKLAEYGINYREWQNIIKKINEEESGLSKLFADCKDTQGLVEKWFLEAVENKLNKEQNRMQKFCSSLEKFLELYNDNITKFEQQERLQVFQNDLRSIEEQGQSYLEASQRRATAMDKLLAYVIELEASAQASDTESSACEEQLEVLRRQLVRLAHEEYSMQYYELEAKEQDVQQQKKKLQALAEAQECKQEELERQVHIYDCAKQQKRVDSDERDVKRREQEVDVKRRRNKELEPERDYLGYVLRQNVEHKVQTAQGSQAHAEKEHKACAEKQKQIKKQIFDMQKQLDELNIKQGALANQVLSYDEVENNFVKKWSTSAPVAVALQRNMLGEYEPGELEIFTSKLIAASEDLERQCKQKQQELKTLHLETEQVERKWQELDNRRQNQEKELLVKQREEEELSNELNYRRTILQYLQLDEKYIFEKERITKALVSKLAELDGLKNKVQQELNAVSKERESLETGRTLELAPELVEMLQDMGVPVVYGFKWLQNNGNTEEQNLELVEKHPFLPYALLMTARDIEILKAAPKQICTSFPVPIVLRDSLTKGEAKRLENGLLEGECVDFLLLFNNNLLNETKLQDLLAKLASREQNLEQERDRRKDEYDTYRGKYAQLEQQKLSQAGYIQLKKDLTELGQNIVALLEEQKNTKARKKELEELAGEGKQALIALQRLSEKLVREHEEFAELKHKYQYYLEQRAELETCKKELGAHNSKQQELYKERDRLVQQSQQLEMKIRELEMELFKLQQELSEYSCYKFVQMPKGLDLGLIKDLNKAKARLDAINNKASGELRSLEEAWRSAEKRAQESRKELENLARRYELQNIDWQEVRYSEAAATTAYTEQKNLVLELKETRNQIISIEKNLSSVQQDIKHLLQEMQGNCANDKPLGKGELLAKDYKVERSKLQQAQYQVQETLRKLQGKLQVLNANILALSEYGGKKPNRPWQECDINALSTEELTGLTSRLRREYNLIKEQEQGDREKLEKILKTLSTKAAYQDNGVASFKKRLDSLIELTGDALGFMQQLAAIMLALQNFAEKLKMDLAIVEQQKAQLVSLLEEYIQEVHKQLGYIDRNSTISVRGRTIKMLKINLPVWDESNAVKYHECVQNLFEDITQKGLELLQQGEPITELLGQHLTTKNIYNEVVGSKNIQLQMYKIEAQREVPISWNEVARNSGGEGFLSAFVILSSLLYYMRWDKNDIFADRNEGKVLLMDNPFAQTSSAHLLTPLMDMAKKNNTQLISLTGLGGESIYNCYDNIYVLNLVSSKLNNKRYLKTKHIAGNEVEIVNLARIEVVSEGDMESLF